MLTKQSSIKLIGAIVNITLMVQLSVAATSITWTLPPGQSATVKVSFGPTTRTLLTECWLNVLPAPIITDAFCTCDVSGSYPAPKPNFHLAPGGTWSTPAVITNTSAALGQLVITPSSLRGCSLAVRAPVFDVHQISVSGNLYTYYADFGSGDFAIITIEGTIYTGGDDELSLPPDRSIGRGGCGCCYYGRSSIAPMSAEYPKIPLLRGHYPQEMSNWCWAAAGQMAIEAVDHSHISQCAQVKKLYKKCDDFPGPGLIIDSFGYPSKRRKTAIDGAVVEMSDDLARTGTLVPWIIRWARGGGRHAMVVTQISNDPTHGGSYIHGFDPLPVNIGSYFIVRASGLMESERSGSLFTSDTFHVNVRKL
jgi:hypothetical protein